MTITAAADGSALGNPGPAGWAWYVDDDRWDAGGWKHATNNIGELTAVLELLRATAHLDDDLLILCDSQYVINCISKWMPGWKKKGWKKADGKPVMNLELLKEIDEAIVGRRFRFEWVKGHAGHPLNEAADARARAASEAYSRGGRVPAGPGYPGAAPGARIEIALESPVEPEAPVEQEAPAEPDTLFDTLFELDEPDLHALEITLSATEHARLTARARHAGVPVEEFLRSLI